MINHSYDADTRVALITLDRPEVKNALDVQHWQELARAVDRSVDSGARAIVLTGAGDVFSAGADLNALRPDEMGEVVEGTFSVIRSAPVPVIAHINGPAIGAGAQLVVSCDLRVVVAERARIGIPAAAIALPAHPGTIARLIALAGTGAARSILLGGEQLSGERAHELGLADRIGTMDDALAWAERIATFAPLVMRYFKKSLQVENPIDTGGYDAFLHTVAESSDFEEAMQARRERRKPLYRD